MQLPLSQLSLDVPVALTPVIPRSHHRRIDELKLKSKVWRGKVVGGQSQLPSNRQSTRSGTATARDSIERMILRLHSASNSRQSWSRLRKSWSWQTIPNAMCSAWCRCWMVRMHSWIGVLLLSLQSLTKPSANWRAFGNQFESSHWWCNAVMSRGYAKQNMLENMLQKC